MNDAKRAELSDQIESAINRCSAENGSNTPDFILAGFLMDCLAAFDAATHKREKWYGRAVREGDAGASTEAGGPPPMTARGKLERDTSTPEKRAWWDEVKRAAENPPRLNMEDGPMTARDGILPLYALIGAFIEGRYGKGNGEYEAAYVSERMVAGLRAVEAAVAEKIEADHRMLLETLDISLSNLFEENVTVNGCLRLIRGALRAAHREGRND